MNYQLQTIRGFARMANLCQGRQNANVLKLILPLFMALIFQTSLQAQNIPIPLTASSFNFDCVAEAAPPSQHATAAMPSNDVIYSTTYPGVNGTGMPANNTITDGTVTYNLQPYNANNCLELGSSGSGDLTFQTPTALATVHLAAFTDNGTANVDVVATFSDGSTEQIGTNFTIADWFNGSNVVHTLNGRVTWGGQVYNLNSGNPRIYTYAFNISAANQSKLITKVTVTRIGGSNFIKPYFFGVAGTPPPPVYQTFSGTVFYNNATQTPFANVDIIYTGTGLPPDTTSTDPADGSFSINMLDGVTYALTYSSTDTWGGANATDALNLLLDSSSAIWLFGLEYRAADVNQDNMVSGADASEIQSRFVSNSVTSYSGGQDWVFDLGSVSLFGGSLTNEKIPGQAMGDINASLHENAPTTSITNDSALVVSDGDRILFPVRLKQAENLGAMSLVVNFPSNAMTIHDVMLGNNTSIMYDVDGNELRAAWTGLDFQHLAANDVLRRLTT